MAMLVLFVSVALVTWGRQAKKSDPRFAVAFTLLGSAFLLLETKGVIQFSLLFGTTWLNNSLVFFAVLVSVLLGIMVAQKVKNPDVVAHCRGVASGLRGCYLACAAEQLAGV